MITSYNQLKAICGGALTYETFDVDKNEFKDYQVANPCGYLVRDFPQDDFRDLISSSRSGRVNRHGI